MTRLDALKDDVIHTAGIVHLNAARQPDGNYSIPAIDWQALDAALGALYRIQRKPAAQLALRLESEAA